MSIFKKDVINESVITLPKITLGDILGKTQKCSEFAGMLKHDKFYIKFIQQTTDGDKLILTTFNVNQQVNLRDDMSELQIIIEPDQTEETKTVDLIEDLNKVYEHVENNKSA